MSGGLVVTGLAALVVALLAAAGAGVAFYQGRFVARTTAAELGALLRPYYRVSWPDGDGPFPTAILVPGCVGAEAHADSWARASPSPTGCAATARRSRSTRWRA